LRENIGGIKPMSKDFKSKKLYRSQSNKMIAGVCGGIAEYFEIDPTLIRLIVVAIALFGGVGLLAYIAAIFIVPSNPDQAPSENSENLIKDKSLFWGSLLIIFGLFFLLRQMGFFYGFEFWKIPWQMVWAAFLIIIGLYLLYNRKKKEDTDTFELKGKKLYRSRKQKMVAGVCGGIAEYFEMDVSVIRILWAIITIASAGFGILIYILMVIIFPEMPDNYEDKEAKV
jgi:phage shock protein C